MQISDLVKCGVITDTWTDMGEFRFLSLIADDAIVLDKKANQLYFSTADEAVFIRRLTGRPELTSVEGDVPNGFVKVFHNGKPYKIRIRGGGFKDSTIGIYHEMISMDAVVGIFK